MRLCCAISRQPEMTLDAYIVTHAADRVALVRKIRDAGIYFPKVSHIFAGIYFPEVEEQLTLDGNIVTLAADRVAFTGARHGILYISFHRNFLLQIILVLESSLRVA